MDTSTKGAAASVFITVVAVCAFAVASANPPQGSGVATGSDAVLGDVTADTVGLGDGTAAAPSLFFQSDDDGTGTGQFRVSANEWAVATNGVQRMSINSSGNTTFPKTVTVSTGTLTVKDDVPLALGNGPDAQIEFDTGQTNDMLVVAADTTSKTILLIDKADAATDFAAPYDGEIAYTDQCIGRVLDRLKALGLFDSALRHQPLAMALNIEKREQGTMPARTKHQHTFDSA